MMLYFAYGSNMDWQRMHSRCPSAVFACTAVLRDAKITFKQRYSTRNESWAASIVDSLGDKTWGVVYRIDEGDLGGLYEAEGYDPTLPPEKSGYIPTRRDVFDGDDTSKFKKITTFVASNMGHPNPPPRAQRLPSTRYKKWIVDGAKHWHLPATYIARLAAIEVADGQ